MRKIGLLIIFIILTGCATMKMVERYPDDAMPWVKGTPPIGCFRGMAMNVANEKEGFHLAMEDAKRQICSTIGFDAREEYERKVMAYNKQVDRKIIANFKHTSAAFLEDIDSSIKDTYFEKWMQKSQYGKNYFCNYYILVHYPQSKINQMKRKTEEENAKRICSLEKCFAFAEEQINKGEFVKALRTYIYALFIADTLFKNSELRTLECAYRIAGLVASLRLAGMGNYVERFVSTHRVSVEAKIDCVPAVNMPIRFEITSGQGRVDPLEFTNRDGLAHARVSMASIREDNKIKALVDFSDILSIDKRLLPLNEVKQVNFTFSTLSKAANVQGGTLYVDKEKESWLKKTPVIKFDLREVNGLGAAFDRYNIEVKGLFERKNWLTGKVKSWTKSEIGSFNLNEKIVIKAKGKEKVVSKWNAWLMDTFKNMSKEKYCQKIRLILTLHGKDSNGNACKVSMESTPMPANSH